MGRPKKSTPAPADPAPETVGAADAADTLNGAQAAEGNRSETTDSAPAASGPAEVPAAPGDTADEVFERRMQRLERIVEGAQFESGTAKGDLVETVLDLFKASPKLWSAMVQSERRDMLKRLDLMATEVLRKVVRVVAQAESNFIEASLDANFAVKGDSIEGKFKVGAADEGAILDMLRMAGHPIVIVSADDKRFAGKRKDIDNPPDQLDIAFADDKPKQPPKATAPVGDVIEAPAGDTDLADEDTVEAVEEVAQTDDVADDWAASIKEGDKVSVTVRDGTDAETVEATVTFIDGDQVDVEYDGGGETQKATVTRADLSPPPAPIAEEVEAVEEAAPVADKFLVYDDAEGMLFFVSPEDGWSEHLDQAKLYDKRTVADAVAEREQAKVKTLAEASA